VGGLVLLISITALAGHHEAPPVKQAIVLAAFGTSYPDALQSILNIKAKVEKANPDTPVRLAFTSEIIRKKWQKRQQDTAWQKANPNIPADVMSVKTPLAVIADLQNDGFRDITVQSLHIFAGEEFANLENMINALRSIRTIRPHHTPFKELRLGRPALETGDDILEAVRVLKADVTEAKDMDAALVYMGHGNSHYSTNIYADFQNGMKNEYDYPIFISCVEGSPSFEDLLAELKAAGKKNVLLKPLMVVAGDHAANDMAGDEEDSWKVMLTKAGFKVTTELRGLGSLDGWADLYVDHLRNAMNQPHGLQ